MAAPTSRAPDRQRLIGSACRHRAPSSLKWRAPRSRRARLLVVVAAVAGLGVSPIEPRAALASPVEQQQERIDTIVDELERLEREAAVLAEDHIDVLAEQTQLESEITELETQLNDQQVALNDLKGQLSQIAVNSFTGSGARSLPFLLASYDAHTVDQQRAVLAGVATDTGYVTTDDLDVALAELDATRSELDARLDRAEDLAGEIEAARDANRQKQTEYERARALAEAELGQLLREEQERRARESYEDVVGVQPTASGDASPSTEDQGADGGSTPSTATPTTGTTPAPGPTTDPPPAQEPAPTPDLAPAPDPAPATPVPPSPSGLAEVAIEAALSQLGVPWIFATAKPGVGFDCSGLTSWAWGRAGIALPHQSRAQFAALPQIPIANAQRGDLLFYYSPISHVGIYLGNGQLVHSPNSGDTVKVSTVNWNNVTGVGRPG